MVGRAGRLSALRVLRRLPGLLQTVLPTFLLAGVAGEVPLRFELCSKLWVQLDQGPGDTELHRARLTRHAATADRGYDVIVLLATDQTQRRDRDHAVHARREVIVDRSPVDREGAVTGGEAHPSDGFLPPSGPEPGWG